jgi:hypothetical protein
MSHFAKVVNGVVVEVIAAELEFFDTYVDTTPGEWIQYSYNTHGGIHYQPNSNIPSEDQSKALRKNGASIGGTYDRERDAFIPPKLYPSWTLNEQTCRWDPPMPWPADDKNYRWDEATLNWVELTEGTS